MSEFVPASKGFSDRAISAGVSYASFRPSSYLASYLFITHQN